MRVGGWRVAAGAALLATALGGCSTVRAPIPPPSPPPVAGRAQQGVASWYGPGFHGNRTASGEIYDQHDLTAAHPSLPHGTRLMVTNLDNGRTVEVRVNDRGPFVGGRVIDLSYAAARVLHMIGPGTARVRIELLGTAVAAPVTPPRPRVVRVAAPAPVRQAVATASAGTWAVEVAALRDSDRAQHLRGVLAYRFPEAFVARETGSEGNSWWRVRLGPYCARPLAVTNAERAVRLGYPAVIVDVESP